MRLDRKGHSALWSQQGLSNHPVTVGAQLSTGRGCRGQYGYAGFPDQGLKSRTQVRLGEGGKGNGDWGGAMVAKILAPVPGDSVMLGHVKGDFSPTSWWSCLEVRTEV